MQRYLFSAAAGQRVSFDEMAILLRSPERCQPLVLEALRRAGIPAHCTRGSSRPHVAGWSCLALLHCAGQFWVRRFRQQAEKLCATLATLIAPPTAPDYTSRALRMLESIGGIAAHRFLFTDLRVHLLGWPAFLAPDGRIVALPSAAPSA